MAAIEWTWKSKDGLEMASRGWVPDGRIKGVICLVHGLGEHVGRYAHVAAVLNEKGYALIGFDLRGHGRSGGQRGHVTSIEIYFDDIDLFLAQIAERYPKAPRYLYGHSLGGILVLDYTPARKPQVSGVIATAPGFRSALERQKVKIAIAKMLGALWPTFTLANGIDVNTLSRDPEVVRAYTRDPLVHDRVSAGWGKSMLDAFRLTGRYAPRFPVPVLVMHGSEDQLGFASGSQEWAALAPKDLCTLKIWPGLYHEIHNEPEKQQVFAFMLDWLAKH